MEANCIFHYCENCWDIGTVGFLFQKTCPVCNGNPKEYHYSKRPTTDPAPQGGTGEKGELREIHIFIHNEEK